MTAVEDTNAGGRMEITIVLEPVDEGGFAVTVPVLPGCFSYGKTKEEALRNAQDAVRLYLKSASDDLKDLKEGSIVEKISL